MRGFRQSLADLGKRQGYLVYSGDETFPLSDTVTALPVSRLDRRWINEEG